LRNFLEWTLLEHRCCNLRVKLMFHRHNHLMREFAKELSMKKT
jgi:hypothetical protein